MKKVIFFIALLSVSFNSCYVEEADLAENRTQKGKLIYDTWSFAMKNTVTDFINIAFHFNYWLEAPAEEKNSIEDSLFSNYKIRKESADVWQLLKGSQIKYRIYCINQSLNNLGARWNIVRYPDSYPYSELPYYNSYSFTSFYSDTMELAISNLTGRKWHVWMNENTTPKTFIDFTFTTDDVIMPIGVDNENMSLSGNGTFRFNYLGFNGINEEGEEDDTKRYGFIDFTIDSPLDYHSGSTLFLFWKSGKVSLEAYNLYQDTIKIEATFLFPEANYNTIQLTYNGVTENYH
jgi:hypothetical protein